MLHYDYEMPDNPLISSLSEILDHFKREAIRLNDRSVYLEANSICLFYLTTGKRLGGAEHEAAVVALNEQLKLVKSLAIQSRKSISNRLRVFLKANRPAEES